MLFITLELLKLKAPELGEFWGLGQDRVRAASRLICDITQRSWDEPEPERGEVWKRLNPCDCSGSLLVASSIFERETGNFSIVVNQGRRNEATHRRISGN